MDKSIKDWKKLIKGREEKLIAEIEEQLPEFTKACNEQGAQAIMLHQDAFAADYQDYEYPLLGKAIKYAGLKGKEVHIMGKNGETLKK